MAASPPFKVHRYGEYVASVRYLEDAAALVAGHPGATIRYRAHHGPVLWREGSEAFSAGDSYDDTASLCMERLNCK